jgi:predicted O-methyltransferase YrrM
MLGTRPIGALLQNQAETPILIERDRQLDGNVSPYELEVIASLVRATAPQTIFEIGTFDGRTTLNMAANAPADAFVYTLDLPPEGLDSTVFSLELNEDKYVKKEKSGARFADSAYNIVQLLGDSGSFDFSPWYGKVDFMFVDGSHVYEYAKSDTLAALKMVRPGGTIIWHDYVREGFTPWPGVPRALKEFFLTDGRFEALTQILGTSIVYLKVPEQTSCADFQPRLLGDSSYAGGGGALRTFARLRRCRDLGGSRFDFSGDFCQKHRECGLASRRQSGWTCTCRNTSPRHGRSNDRFRLWADSASIPARSVSW